MNLKLRGIQRDGKKLGYPRYASCFHYEPAIVSEGKIKESARSYVGVDNRCRGCDLSLNSKQRKNIETIVDLLNRNVDDDKQLAKLFNGIPVGEIQKRSPFDVLVQEAVLQKGAVPIKNK